MFVNLWTHSFYSFSKSILSIDDIINFSKSNNIPYAALTDINVAYGNMEFYQKCLKANIKPIIGMQITYEKAQILLIAKNQNGLCNINKVSSAINCKNDFNLSDYISDVILISLENKILNIKTPDFYLAKEIAIRESVMKDSNDTKSLKVLKAINENVPLSSFDKLTYFNDKYLLTSDQANELFTANQLSLLEQIIDKINLVVELPKPIDFVNFTSSPEASESLLKNICELKLRDYLKNKKNSVYIERVKYELKVITQMGFVDYFLVVYDIIKWSREQKILIGPGRGSSAGSLVAFLLDITKVDPIKYNLLFERFLNIERKNLPDIDIDVPSNRREEIITYISEKYGKNSVASIVTFQRNKIKAALKDAGRVLGIKLELLDLISKTLKEDEENGDYRNNQYFEKYPELFSIAINLVNVPRQTGKHAAGIVLTSNSLGSIVPIEQNYDGTITTQYSMEFLEELGVIKLDLLSLNYLAIIDHCIELIKNELGETINVYDITYDDTFIYQELSQGKTLGLFQIESYGMTSLIKKIAPKNLEDISVVLALYRPGANAFLNDYIWNKKHPEKINYINEQFEKILSPTYNVAVYQEQIMEIIKVVGNYSLADADIFRRIMSKKKKEELEVQGGKFKTAALKNGYSESQVAKIYQFIENFAGYGFNHSHSIAYAVIVYWTAYLKFKYPVQYLTCILSTFNNEEKTIKLIEEIRSMGYRLALPDINLSKDEFSSTNKTIYPSFFIIKGIGNETINKIISIRQEAGGEFLTLNRAIADLVKIGITLETLKKLCFSGCFDLLLEKENHSRIWLVTNIEVLAKALKTSDAYGNFIINPGKQIQDIENITLESQTFLLEQQLNTIGMTFSKIIPNSDYYDLKSKYDEELNFKTIEEIVSKNTSGNVLAEVVSIDKFNNAGKKITKVFLTDTTGSLVITIFNSNEKYDTLQVNTWYSFFIEKTNTIVDFKKLQD
ncbi:MAG: DNA polymerase III subunit alpha [Mycoplasmataceae bacterium]|nr:DNA polymerase III subunit alpha [Mycoplasmataceae bacterium]